MQANLLGSIRDRFVAPSRGDRRTSDTRQGWGCLARYRRRGSAFDQLRVLFFDCRTLCGTMYDMTARLNEPTERRTPLPLTARDLADLGKLREPGPERAALSALANSLPEGDVSEALLVHAVFVAGLRAVREAAEAASYEADAPDRHARADADRAAARRRRPSWDDED